MLNESEKFKAVLKQLEEDKFLIKDRVKYEVVAICHNDTSKGIPPVSFFVKRPKGCVHFLVFLHENGNISPLTNFGRFGR